MAENVLLEWALWYARVRDWPVIALHTPDGKGGCSCGLGPTCHSQGKHPRFHKTLLPNGPNSGTTDPELIKKWWGMWPHANIGIATGKKSFDVLDVDIKGDGPDTLSELEQKHGKIPDTVEQVTGSGGRQIMFVSSGAIGNEVRFAGGLDTRSDGGLVVVPPSLHISGKRYCWEASSSPADNVQLSVMPDWLIDLISITKLKASGNGGGIDVAKILSGIEEGSRDKELFRYACRLRTLGLAKEEAKPILFDVASKCKPPFSEQEATKKLNQAWKYDSSPRAPLDYPSDLSESVTNVANVANVAGNTNCRKLSQTTHDLSQTVANSPNYLEIFKTWLESCDGDFKMQEAARELGWLQNLNHYACFRRIVSRACELGLITKASRARGIYRAIKKEYKEVDLMSEISVDEFPVVLPLGLHKLAEINPKEIILIAGETNAGKTAIIYNILWSNILHLKKLGLLRRKNESESGKVGLRYFSSEMGPSAIKKKLLDFGSAYPIDVFSESVITIADRSTGFQDILDPDGINCIDYLEPPNGDYYMMAPTITEYFSKLGTGICVIAIQKKTGQDTARGGEATLEKPRLAIALSYNRDRGYFTAKITKAKAPRDGIGIDGLEMDFSIEKGVRIIELSTWDYPSNHKKNRDKMDFRKKRNGSREPGEDDE